MRPKADWITRIKIEVSLIVKHRIETQIIVVLGLGWGFVKRKCQFMVVIKDIWAAKDYYWAKVVQLQTKGPISKQWFCIGVSCIKALNQMPIWRTTLTIWNSAKRICQSNHLLWIAFLLKKGEIKTINRLDWKKKLNNPLAPINSQVEMHLGLKINIK